MICLRVMPFRYALPGALAMTASYRKVASLSRGFATFVYNPLLKEQRGMRQFRRRGLEKVAVEFALAATAFNLTRLWRNKPKLNQEG